MYVFFKSKEIVNFNWFSKYVTNSLNLNIKYNGESIKWVSN
jgi:hypothetical protein